MHHRNHDHDHNHIHIHNHNHKIESKPRLIMNAELPLRPLLHIQTPSRGSHC
ncbi:hypothetical protein BDV41DRAFT_559018 [Aspergillus transmontanensis]|uniref:Uncharacterized protein n=1 Tax=Aspergillus transmontanensis TaxID=1034304 RepID=A0A5N6VDA1_9EURO|nr:hypothetical protein BDV41DRAFT_559018 [Aspergillus transmontanensis]